MSIDLKQESLDNIVVLDTIEEKEISILNV